MKNFLLICLKNALNAILTNTTLLATMPTTFNFTQAGIIAMLKVAGGCVLAREGSVWLPVLLKWSTTDATPDSVKQPSA